MLWRDRPQYRTVDELLSDLTAEEWAGIQAADMVLPFDHAEKMLGMIAYMLHQTLSKDADDDALQAACLPWLDGALQMATGADFRAQVAGLGGP